MLTCGNICCGHEILICGNWERHINLWERDIMSWPRDHFFEVTTSLCRGAMLREHHFSRGHEFNA